MNNVRWYHIKVSVCMIFCGLIQYFCNLQSRADLRDPILCSLIGLIFLGVLVSSCPTAVNISSAYIHSI